jgi:hypothetical protein
MSTNTSKPPTQEDADHWHMLDHAFKKTPLVPEVSKRVRDDSARMATVLRIGSENPAYNSKG